MVAEQRDPSSARPAQLGVEREPARRLHELRLEPVALGREREYASQAVESFEVAARGVEVDPRGEVGEQEVELHPADGHTPDGMALLVPWAGVLICGDYLSPVETPEGHTADAAAYRATLERLRPLAAGAEWVVPGHGVPMASARALEILDDHLAKL